MLQFETNILQLKNIKWNVLQRTTGIKPNIATFHRLRQEETCIMNIVYIRNSLLKKAILAQCLGKSN